MDKAKWLIANSDNRNLMVGARVTITDRNIDKQKELIDYFCSLGIRRSPLFYSVGQVSVCEDAKKRNNFYYCQFIAEYQNAETACIINTAKATGETGCLCFSYCLNN